MHSAIAEDRVSVVLVQLFISTYSYSSFNSVMMEFLQGNVYLCFRLQVLQFRYFSIQVIIFVYVVCYIRNHTFFFIVQHSP